MLLNKTTEIPRGAARARDAGRPQAASPRFRAPARARPRALHRRHPRARRACCISPSGMANKAAGQLVSLDLDAVRAAPGVVAVLTAADIPGANDIAPVFKDEPLFATEEILYFGQPLFAVVATHARGGAPRREARQDRDRRSEARADRRGRAGRGRRACCPTTNSAAATSRRRWPPRRIVWQGKFAIGGQEHFYLEGQISMAAPGEGREMSVWCSTQDPTEVQHIVAPHPRHSRRFRHRRDAPHGRRLRRQGEPGLRLGGDGRARRTCHRRALQGAGSTATTISS